MQGDKKYSKIYVGIDNQPSTYMVDLKEVLKEKESQKILEKSDSWVLKKTKKSIKQSLGLKSKKIKTQKRDQKEEEIVYTQAIFENEQNFEKKSQIRGVTFSEKLRQLALVQFFVSIYSLLKQLFRLIEKICFQVGWVVVFFVRIIYFVVLRILLIIQGVFIALFNFFVTAKKNKPRLSADNYQIPEPLITQSLMDLAVLKIEETKNDFTINTKGAQEHHSDSELDGQQKNAELCPVQKNCTVTNHQTAMETKKTFKFTRPKLNFAYLKPAIYFTLFLFVLVLPFKALTYFGVLKDLGGRVLGASEEAIGNLKNAGSAIGEKDFNTAELKFNEASNNFIRAQDEISYISSQLKVLGAIIPNQKLRLAADADYFLEAGQISARIGQRISFVFDAFSSENDKSIKNVFNSFYDNIDILLADIKKLDEVLYKINVRNLPPENRDSFEILREKTRQINNSFIELSDLLKKMHTILGFEGEKRYMFIFQNNSEMRASGGFMGSFSIIDIKNGEIVKIDTPKGGTYDTEGAFYERIVAPEPLQIVNPLWHFWDANWWPDWKKTAKKLKWFYEKSGGSTVDGVIGLTPVVAERLLNIIGPLDMENTHGVTINAENFWQITQTFSEEKPIGHPDYEPLPFVPKNPELNQVADVASSSVVSVANKQEPKKIIGDLIDVIKTELPKRMNKDIFMSLFSSFEQSLSEKHIIFYFDDWNVQSKFEELGWAGRMDQTSFDYLMVVNSNISGAKSDRKIKQEINHEAEVQADGSIINTLHIKRIHTGEKGEKFTGVLNLDWMRIYVPLGSQFLEASGFWPPDESLFEKPDPSWKHDPDLANSEENFVRDRDSWTKIYNEDNKTVFANWAQVKPGESVEIVIKYILPFKLSQDLSNSNQSYPYSLLVEKQPGAETCDISSRLSLPLAYKIDWQYPNDLITEQSGWYIKDQLSVDKFWAVTAK